MNSIMLEINVADQLFFYVNGDYFKEEEAFEHRCHLKQLTRAITMV